jgi:hypothetical protein
MKRGVMILLGNTPRGIFDFRAIWPILWPPGGHLVNQSFEALMVVVKLTKCLWEVYLIRLHHIYPGFGFDLLFKGTEVKVWKKLRSWRILLLFDLECSNFVWICIWGPSTFPPNFDPVGFQIWPWGLEAILEK